MIVTRYMALCSIERAECLAMMTTAQLIEFSRKFYSDVPAYQEQRAARHMATIIEALCDELEASRKKIDRLEECSDRFNPDCECPSCKLSIPVGCGIPHHPDDLCSCKSCDDARTYRRKLLEPRPEIAGAVTA